MKKHTICQEKHLRIPDAKIAFFCGLKALFLQQATFF